MWNKCLLPITVFATFLILAMTGLSKAQGSLFESPIEIDTAEPGTVVVSDIDNDGDNDLIVTDRNGNKFTVFYNDGNCNFPTIVPYNSMGNVTALPAVGDFNNDGQLDIAVPHARSSTLEVFLQDQLGVFNHSQSLSFGTYHVEAFAADFNGDGYDDVAVLAELSHNMAIYEGIPSGLSFKTSFGVGDACYGMTAADFDGDNKIDIAVPRHYHQTVSVYFNDGNFGFSDGGMTYPVGTRPVGIFPGDFRENSFPDLAIANREDDDISILTFNNTTNEFDKLDDVPAGNGALFITADDFDGDGHIDLAAGNMYSNDVDIFLGDGTGNFWLAETIQTGPVSRITSGDLNNDGAPDLVVPLGPIHKIKIYLAYKSCEYGPDDQPLVFTRHRGSPKKETVEWESCGGFGIMIISNNGVSAAEIYLNGELIVGPEKFNRKLKTTRVAVELHPDVNVLEVILRSKPGSSIDVEFTPSQ